MVRLSLQATEALRPGEVLVFDWHRVAICCACAGEVSLRAAARERLDRSRAFRPLTSDPPGVVYAHRFAFPHLAERDVAIHCKPRMGFRRFRSNLPPDFGLRAVFGRLPASPSKEEPS